MNDVYISITKDLGGEQGACMRERDCARLDAHHARVAVAQVVGEGKVHAQPHVDRLAHRGLLLPELER